MPDNSTTEMLIRYIDDELNETDRQAAEKLLQEDASLQEQYQYLMAAKKAIKSHGLKKRVQAIHQQYVQESTDIKKSTVKVVKHPSTITTFIRVAAIVIVVMGVYGTFQFIATTNQSVYKDNFISYQLPVSRGAEDTDHLDAFYNAGNYNAVITAFKVKQIKNQKDYFLAAQSYLQLNNADAAINTFKQVKNLNNNSTNKYFEQETDYYLMLAYIKAGQIDEAKKLQDKITTNKHHLFYNKANNISQTKLYMLKWKG